MDQNPYCSKLGIAIPDLRAIVERHKKVKLFHFMVVALVQRGEPMSLTEIARRLYEVGVGASIADLELGLKRAWHGSEPVHKRPDGLYALDLTSSDLDLILYMTGARPPRHLISTQTDAGKSQTSTPMPGSGELRRAVFRTAPSDGPSQAACLLDFSTHIIHTLVGNDLQRLPQVLTGFDLLVGLDLRDSLYLAGMDPQAWKLADLRSAPKSTRINRRGRTLRITPEMLIKSTTGISQPLGDQARVAGYLERNDQTKLIRRLGADVKALYAFYQYGILHGYVRLRWGFLDELLPVFWGLPEEPDLNTILRKSIRIGAPVDVVTGQAPALDTPWKRTRRGYIVDIGEWGISLRWGNDQWTVHRYEIQAVRVVEDWATTVEEET